MANLQIKAASDHAGTVEDPIPQQLLYTKTSEDGTKKVYTIASGVAGTVDISDANATTKGITMLSDATDSDLNAATGVTAATPLAVKTSLAAAKEYADTKAEETLAAAKQYTDDHSGVDVADANASTKGITKLSDAVNSTSDAASGVTAATPKAVKTAYDLANTANTTAVTAQTTAQAAQSTADTANATAQAAQTAANARILVTGDRGQIAGSETSASLSGSQTITKDSADTTVISTSGAVTLTFTPAAANVCAVKVICLNATAETTLSISGASWANAGTAPTWGSSGARLILVANFIAGVVIVNVFDNSQG